MPVLSTARDHLQRLDELRPAFENLKAERIGAESDISRRTRELDEARRRARDEFGTDDEDEIRRLIAAARAESEAMVEDFAARVRAIEARLKQLGAEA